MLQNTPDIVGLGVIAVDEMLYVQQLSTSRWEEVPE